MPIYESLPEGQYYENPSLRAGNSASNVAAPTGLKGTSGGINWTGPEAMGAYAAIAQAMLAAEAQRQAIIEAHRQEQNARFQHAGDAFAGLFQRGGENAFDKNRGEADAISTILSRTRS